MQSKPSSQLLKKATGQPKKRGRINTCPPVQPAVRQRCKPYQVIVTGCRFNAKMPSPLQTLPLRCFKALPKRTVSRSQLRTTVKEAAGPRSESCHPGAEHSCQQPFPQTVGKTHRARQHKHRPGCRRSDVQSMVGTFLRHTHSQHLTAHLGVLAKKKDQAHRAR
jgi:hypothetical protein